MNYEARRAQYVSAATLAGTPIIETPNRILTPEERIDRAKPSPFFRVRFDEDTGIYRDCPACDGWGEFPGPEGVKGCAYCKMFAESDYDAHCKCNPPVTFRADRPEDIESAKKFLSLETLAAATESPEAHEKHWREMQEDQERRTQLHAKSVPHFLFSCYKCQSEKAVEKGSHWSWRWVKEPRCCDYPMEYHKTIIPEAKP